MDISYQNYSQRYAKNTIINNTMRKQTTIVANTQYYSNRTQSPLTITPLKAPNIVKQKQPQQHKIPNNSIMSPVQPLNLSTNNSALLALSNNNMTADGMSKIITMMREQIQTSSNFYVSKMKKLLQEQAKEICALRDRIMQNQRDLVRKTAIIDQLKNNNQKQRQSTPKKKLSVLSSQPDYITNQSTQQLSQKVNQLQLKLAGLQQTLHQRNQSQKQMNKKVQQVQKGTIKYFASKMAGCQSKLDKYLIKKQNQIQKIYGDLNIYIKMGEDNGFFNNKNAVLQKSSVNNLAKTQNIVQTLDKRSILSNTTIKKQPPTSIYVSNLTNRQIKLGNQIQQLRQQMAQIKIKQYKYDNHQVQILKDNINRIKKYLDTHQCSSGNGTRKDNSVHVNSRQIISDKNIRSNQQPYNNNHINSNNSINLAKSQKLIAVQHPNLSNIPPQKTTNLNTINPTPNRPNLYPPPNHHSHTNQLPATMSQPVIQNIQKPPQRHHNNVQSSKNINIYYHNNNNDGNQVNTLNLSTPTVYKHEKIQTNYNTNPIISSSNKNMSGENVKNYSPSYYTNNHINNSTKTVVKAPNLAETSVTSYMNDHSYTNKYKTNNPTYNNDKHINLFKPFEEQPPRNNPQSKTQPQPPPQPQLQIQASKQKILQNQFYDENQCPENTHPNNKQHYNSYEQYDQESIQYEEQSSYHQYEEEPSTQYVRISNIDRLINTINQHKMTMPVFVEIDQTGYLKCIMTGMYLVDSNDDGFELLDQQIKQLTNKQIIKLANTSNYNHVNPYTREHR